MESHVKDATRVKECWLCIQKAVITLSNPKLTDCVTFLNHNVFNNFETNINHEKIFIRNIDSWMNEVDNEMKMSDVIVNSGDNGSSEALFSDENMKDFVGKPVMCCNVYSLSQHIYTRQLLPNKHCLQ